ncbi:alpha/beta fold hydrolase [Candidatus Foliamicus sp.]
MIPTKAYAPSRFGQMHYRIAMPEAASQPPLLCLHQTPSNGSQWEPIQPALARDRVVVAPDTPGYGMSDPPPEPPEIGDYAGAMFDFMEHLAERGIVAPGPFDVMGYHTGSITATEMAHQDRQRVRRCVLFGLAAYPEDVRAGKLARLSDRFPAPDRTLAHVEKLWSIIGELADPRIPPEELHIGMAESLRLGSRLPWGYIAVYRYDFLGAMAEVEQPVLVFNPEDDLWDVTRETSHLFQAGRRLDIPGVSHGLLSLERDFVVGEIERFLRQ